MGDGRLPLIVAVRLAGRPFDDSIILYVPSTLVSPSVCEQASINMHQEERLFQTVYNHQDIRQIPGYWDAWSYLYDVSIAMSFIFRPLDDD